MEDFQMNDHDIVLTIQEIMDGCEWTSDTMSLIADLLTENGYRIRDLDDTIPTDTATGTTDAIGFGAV
jgi:hypothetical protein